MKKTRSYSVKLQVIVAGRANIGSLVAKIIKIYLGTVGTRELEEICLEQVLAEYEARDEFQDVADYLVKDVLCVAISSDVSIVNNTIFLGRCGLVGCSKSNRAMN